MGNMSNNPEKLACINYSTILYNTEKKFGVCNNVIITTLKNW